MDMVKDIEIEDYDYLLPEVRIPLHPLEKRDECKLLVRSPQGKIYHRIFKELPDLLPPGSLLVCNDTKVINARLSFHKNTGAEIELFLLEPLEPSDYALSFQSRQHCKWKCLVGNSKKWKDGEIFLDIPVESEDSIILKALRTEKEDDGSSAIDFYWDNPQYTFGQLIENAGKIPIPPYLNRDTEDSDRLDYQTVYAREKGSVAAPTAGLHFTPEVFENLKAHSVVVEKLTLHVGAGTFRPVKSSKIGEHPMHAEPFSVSRSLIEKLLKWKKEDRPVVAVGTTSVRTLESLPYVGKALIDKEENPFQVNQWSPYENASNGLVKAEFDTVEALDAILKWMDKENSDTIAVSTSIMIAPGFNWRICDGMVTNFHQPKSTLLLLVSSFLGGTEWRKVYEAALSGSYRFLSYGDACLFL